MFLAHLSLNFKNVPELNCPDLPPLPFLCTWRARGKGAGTGLLSPGTPSLGELAECSPCQVCPRAPDLGTARSRPETPSPSRAHLPGVKPGPLHLPWAPAGQRRLVPARWTERTGSHTRDYFSQTPRLHTRAAGGGSAERVVAACSNQCACAPQLACLRISGRGSALPCPRACALLSGPSR